MKIGFYSPYFDSLSGGERYVLTVASHWSKSHDVSLFWDDPSIIQKAQQRLHIDLKGVKTVENIFRTKNVFKKLAVTRGYDLIFFLTDGSIPTTFAKKNILHFQVPFRRVSVHPIKLSRFQVIVCNSQFTKKHLDWRLAKRSVVIYPPVTMIPKQKTQKKNFILSVGRFHPIKKQDILIDIFKHGLSSKIFSRFSLILAGGLMPSDKEYFEKLQVLAKGMPIQFYPNLSFDKLASLYHTSRVYWHAAGFDEQRPENMEHFGITTVEAMSAGCIPIVYNAGGQPEIVQEGVNGYLWGDKDECIKKTFMLLKDEKKERLLRSTGQKQSNRFDVSVFTKQFDLLLSHITE